MKTVSLSSNLAYKVVLCNIWVNRRLYKNCTVILSSIYRQHAYLLEGKLLDQNCKLAREEGCRRIWLIKRNEIITVLYSLLENVI